MAIQTYLDNLKTKPEHIRRRIAFWSSFGVTAVIFAFWLASFGAVGNGAKTAVASAVEKAGTPAQSLVASVGSFFVDIKELVFGPKKVTYSSVQVLPGK